MTKLRRKLKCSKLHKVPLQAPLDRSHVNYLFKQGDIVDVHVLTVSDTDLPCSIIRRQDWDMFERSG